MCVCVCVCVCVLRAIEGEEKCKTVRQRTNKLTFHMESYQTVIEAAWHVSTS